MNSVVHSLRPSQLLGARGLGALRDSGPSGCGGDFLIHDVFGFPFKENAKKYIIGFQTPKTDFPSKAATKINTYNHVLYNYSKSNQLLFSIFVSGLIPTLFRGSNNLDTNLTITLGSIYFNGAPPIELFNQCQNLMRRSLTSSKLVSFRFRSESSDVLI